MKHRHIIRSAATVSLFTGLSRLLGMFRDILMASFFGVGIHMSAFVLAWTIPNLFRRLFGEGALAAAFIPVFVETRSKEGEKAAWQLAGHILGLLLVVLLAFLFTGWILIWIGGKLFTSFFAVLTLSLLNILLPYMVFICLAAMAMSILNAYKHFAVPAFAPCLLNLVWILCITVGFRFIGDDGSYRIQFLAGFILLAGALQLLVQLPLLYRFGFRGRVQFNFHDPKVKRILLLMGPAALGMAVTQCNVMVDRLLAGAIGLHAPAALFFAERLIYLPLGVFATAMGTVLLPSFSHQRAAGDSAAQLQTVQRSFRLLCFLVVPAAAGLFVLSEPLIRMLLAQGQFNERAVFYTSIALRFYAPGLILFSLAKIFVPVFYSHQDTRTPVLVGVASVFVNLALNLAFFFTWPQEIKHAGLALATVLSEGMYILVLIFIFHRRYGSPGWSRMLYALLRFGSVAFFMAIFVVWVEHSLFLFFESGGLNTKMSRVASVLLGIFAGGSFYFFLSALCRFHEWGWIWDRVRPRSPNR